MTSAPALAFRHEALLYADEAAFVAGTVPFLREAIAADEPTLVVVDAAKIAVLCSVLGDDADHVLFADMATVGKNPARIIPAWRKFVDDHHASGPRSIRGIGEPIWAGRTPAELVECRHHEALLNLAFADTQEFWLLCPYDAVGLDPAVITEAHGTHPFVSGSGAGATYAGSATDDIFVEPLPTPSVQVEALEFTTLAPVRRFVTDRAEAVGLSEATTADLVLAVDELAANSLLHGGGAGTLSVWQENGSLISEVSDQGHITDPLVGRRAPLRSQLSGRGLWMVNQICQLLQIRTSAHGTTIRLHVPAVSP